MSLICTCEVTHRTGAQSTVATAYFYQRWLLFSAFTLTIHADRPMPGRPLPIRCFYPVSQRQWYWVKTSEETRPVPAARVWLCKSYNQKERQTPVQSRALQCKTGKPCSEESFNTMYSLPISFKLLFTVFSQNDQPLMCRLPHAKQKDILQEHNKYVTNQVFKLIP